MQAKYIDGITKIYNEEYLKINYQTYIDNNPNSNFIMIDIEKFKNLNDTFGHNVGDTYLFVFGKILSSSFKDSIVVRLHGDEFAILTKYSEDEMEKIFKLCNQKISNAFMEGIIPKIFGFNAGVCKAEHSIKITKEKSDIMMYFAKKNGMNFQRFDSLIYQEKLTEDSFLQKIDLSLKNDGFSYSIRQLFDKNNTGQNLYQIYTKELTGESLFGNCKYDILKNTSKIRQFDSYNVQYLLENMVFKENQFFIILDYRTLIQSANIIDYLKILNDVFNFPINNVIFSIDLFELDSSYYSIIINKINILKSMGFKIRLEKVDSLIGDKIFEETDIDYVKFLNEYWKKTMGNEKVLISMESKLNMYDKLGIIPIFDKLESEDEFEFLKENTPNNTLFSGNYFSNEKKLILKNR